MGGKDSIFWFIFAPGVEEEEDMTKKELRGRGEERKKWEGGKVRRLWLKKIQFLPP